MKRIRKETVISVIICLMPVLVTVLCLMIKGQSFQNIIPIWSDEVNYYHIIESMIDYGSPLGYNGYNGSSALLGTYGFHGVVILLPYYIFCLCFGLNTYSIALCNVFLVVLALCIFQLLNKIEWKKLFAISILASFSPMVMTFFTINMVEGVNIFFAITIAGGFIRVVKKPSNKISYFLLLLIVLATLSKVTWGVCMLPWLVLRTKGSMMKRFTLSSILTCIFVLLNYILFSLLSAPYFESQITTILNMLNVNGVKGILDIIMLFFRNLYYPFVLGFTNKNALVIVTSITLVMLIAFSIFMSIHFAYNIYKHKKTTQLKEDDILKAISIWLFISTYFGIALLYASSLVVLRTLYPIFLCCLILFIFAYDRKMIFTTISFLTVASFVVVAFDNIYYDPRSFATNDYTEMVKNQANYLREAIQIDEDGDGWENTIAATLDVPMSYWLGAPSGTGYNLYKDISVNLDDIKAKYVLVLSSNQELIDKLIENGYHIYTGDIFTRLLVK